MELEIEKLTRRNEAFRNVVFTDSLSQVVLMALRPGEEVGEENHPFTSQFVRVETGSGVAIIDDKEYRLKPGSAVVIPPKTYHNIIADNPFWMKFYTIYSGEILHPEDGYEWKNPNY